MPFISIFMNIQSEIKRVLILVESWNYMVTRYSHECQEIIHSDNELEETIIWLPGYEVQIYELKFVKIKFNRGHRYERMRLAGGV